MNLKWLRLDPATGASAGTGTGTVTPGAVPPTPPPAVAPAPAPAPAVTAIASGDTVSPKEYNALLNEVNAMKSQESNRAIGTALTTTLAKNGFSAEGLELAETHLRARADVQYDPKTGAVTALNSKNYRVPLADAVVEFASTPHGKRLLPAVATPGAAVGPDGGIAPGTPVHGFENLTADEIATMREKEPEKFQKMRQAARAAIRNARR